MGFIILEALDFPAKVMKGDSVLQHVRVKEAGSELFRVSGLPWVPASEPICADRASSLLASLTHPVFYRESLITF